MDPILEVLAVTDVEDVGEHKGEHQMEIEVLVKLKPAVLQTDLVCILRIELSDMLVCCCK